MKQRPTVTCDATGSCAGGAVNSWAPSEAAIHAGLSIVVHDTPNNGGSGSGSKMFRVDLMPPRVFKGAFPFRPSHTPIPNTYVGFTGAAELNVWVAWGLRAPCGSAVHLEPRVERRSMHTCTPDRALRTEADTKSPTPCRTRRRSRQGTTDRSAHGIADGVTDGCADAITD